METHLKTCDVCRESYDSVKHGHNAILQSLPLLAPECKQLTGKKLEGFKESAEAALSTPGKRKIISFRHKTFHRAAAAAALIIAFGTLLMFQQGVVPETGPDQEPPPRVINDMSSQEAAFRLLPEVGDSRESGPGLTEDSELSSLAAEEEDTEWGLLGYPPHWTGYDSLLTVQDKARQEPGE